MLVWEDEDIYSGEFVRAVGCPLNPGIPNLNGSLEAYIYVDEILAYGVNKHNILRLLATTIKTIFTVYDCPNIKVQQCPLSLKKWEKLMVGWFKLSWDLPLTQICSQLGLLPNI
jgi:hypothetical protein